jgi:AcrR family transcriptional regulator
VIATAAIEIADADGLANVSMPRLARRLGVSTMALYRYVEGKRALVGLMVDSAVGERSRRDHAKGNWRRGLSWWAEQTWIGFCEHPWLIEASVRHRLMGPNELSWVDKAVGLLEGSGLSGPERLDAVLVLAGHVRSMAQYATNRSGDAGAAGGDWNSATVRLVKEDSQRYPALLSAVEEGALDAEDTNGLGFGTRCILDGMETLIARKHTGSPP